MAGVELVGVVVVVPSLPYQWPLATSLSQSTTLLSRLCHLENKVGKHPSSVEAAQLRTEAQRSRRKINIAKKISLGGAL